MFSHHLPKVEPEQNELSDSEDAGESDLLFGSKREMALKPPIAIEEEDEDEEENSGSEDNIF